MADPVRHARFRYVDAGDLANDRLDLNGLDIRNGANEKIGEIDGFLVDADTERPYYIVVDSGGWFSGGNYLLPINHGRLESDPDRNSNVLRVNLDKDAMRQFPKFDRDEFGRLPETEVRGIEARILRACFGEQALPADAGVNYDRWEYYRQPDWWDTRWTRGDRARRVAGDYAVTPESGESRFERERIIAAEEAPVGDRAQPGDVLGIETGGEETHLGDTARDEDRRVEISDREVRKAEKNERG